MQARVTHARALVCAMCATLSLFYVRRPFELFRIVRQFPAIPLFFGVESVQNRDARKVCSLPAVTVGNANARARLVSPTCAHHHAGAAGSRSVFQVSGQYGFFDYPRARGVFEIFRNIAG